MNTRKHILVVLSILLVASFVLSACQAQQVVKTVTVVQTVEVPQVQVTEVVKTETVIQTQVVEVAAKAFTTPDPILSDLKVRQALDYCTNRLDLIKAVYPLLTEDQQKSLVMWTMIPRDSWAYAGDDNVTTYPFDAEKGKALLDEAGWKINPDVNPDVRTNDKNETLSLKFTTTNATFRQTWGAVWQKQMADCGVQIITQYVPASWWFGDTTGLARRDFQLGAYAWVGEPDPGGTTLWQCDQIPTPDNGWTGQNYMGWCNQAADTATKNANNTLVKDERIKWYAQLQQEYTKDVPAIPLFNRTETFSTDAKLTNFDPKPGESYYTYNAGTWTDPGKNTLVLGLTQEPASLFGLVEDAFVAHVVLNLIGADRTYTSLNYDYQPVFYKELPSIENGTAVNTAVDVKAGDMVVDATGTNVKLENGVKVKDSTGQEVEFTGQPLKMNQLTTTYEFRDDLKWPDGTPLAQEDLELGWKIKCDKESGATSFILCDKTADIKFDGLKVTRTALPGDQDPQYFILTDFYIYPAHRVLSDGRKLADVPAKEYATLPEIAQQPWGFGPYMVKDWVKGEKIVLETDPYWFGGTPATPNFTVAIVTPENSEAQLLAGQIDILGSESLTGIDDTLNKAEQAGKVKNYVIPGGTWEHIDFNLFEK
jgi:peptide/nickel transport system substrate-binding protein